MKKNILLLITCIIFSSNLSATWSIIIIDPKTKEIGIAGASCTYNCYGIGKIVPNMGGIIVQAMSNVRAREKGIEMILAEAPPEQIIQALRDPAFDPEHQQYAVVTIKHFDNPATYTGISTQEARGSMTKAGVSVQGNTLASEDELRIIMQAVENGREKLLDIAEILLMALEAGSISGGDKRCGNQKASSAFIIVANPDSKRPYINLNIFGQGKGGQNAVDLLRRKFDKWKRRHGKELESTKRSQ